ncbi:MAG: LysE family transporter [Alphaproteobacteria bacterium]|nr:LysE family transporter [Alphaproteobacteria bacterium]
MDPLHALAGLALLHIASAMLPGPNVLVISHLAAARSRRHGLRAAAGVAAGSLLWVTASLAGVGLLLLEAGWLYRLLRMVAAAYLLYVGARLLLAALRPAPDGRPIPLVRRAAQAPFLAGLLTTLSNPKSAVFWTSLFIVAVPPDVPGWFYGAVLAVVAVQSTAWYSLVALTLSTGPARRTYARAGRWLDAVAGLAMVGVGVRLAAEIRGELAR